VSEPQSVQIIEKTHEYNGLYHILRGTVRPDDFEPAKYLKINELTSRINHNIDEVVLALNPDINGENTMMYLEKILSNTKQDLKVTRLARGLPMGSDLNYADEITLGAAIKNRMKLKLN